MGNTRGNTWSHEHETLDSCSNCTEYWMFSWDKTGQLDYSVEIDYVLSETGFDDLYFVGYSMGTTQYFVLLSEMPEYNAKIKAGFLMGPAAFMANATSPLFEEAEIADDLQMELHERGISNLFYS